MPSEPQAPIREEIRQLTGLRGFAALDVAVSHYGLADTPGLRTLVFANAAVDVFFCLSSFTLCLVYGCGLSSHLPFRRYAIARVARVYPLFVITALVVMGYNFAWHLGGFPARFDHRVLIQLIRQATLLQEIPLPFLGPMGSWDLPAWSISVEAFCYVLIFPALFLLARRARLLSTGAIVLGMMCLVATSFIAYVKFFNPNLDGPEFPQPAGGMAPWVPLIRGITMFGAGWLAYLLFLWHREATVFMGAITNTLALGFLCVVASESFGLLPSASVVMIAPFLVLGLMDGNSITARILASGPMHYLGVISYSLYLWHLPVRTIAQHIWPWSSNQHIFHGIVWPLSLALIVSSLSCFLIELPARNAIKRLAARGTRAMPAAARPTHINPAGIS